MSRYTLLNRIFPRMMAVLLVLMLLGSLAPAVSAAESGSCGEKLEWSFEGGTLTITGKGRMTDYSYLGYAPWYEFREQIIRLELPDGLTHVGDMAFFDCSNLQVISLPSRVESVGELAFCQCTGAVLIQFNDGLKSIGRSAFELCSGVQDIRLPDSLTAIGNQAFYRCEALRYVTIPASVTQMGASVFAYCTGLIRADVKAPLATLPRWTFYGCKSLSVISLEAETTALGELSLENCYNLSTVYYDGSEMDAEELMEQITQQQENFSAEGEISSGEPGNSGSSTGAEVNEEGDVIISDSTVTQTEESVITVTEESNASGGGEEAEGTRIEATIRQEEGWDQLQDAIEDAAENGPVDATVYDSTGDGVPQEFLDALSGRDVFMQVTTSNGSYTLDFRNMEDISAKDGLDLSYTLTLVEESRYDELQGYLVYELRFDKSSQVPVGAAIALPVENNRATASLYQVRGGKLEYLQAAVVNEKGVVHFYLATVDKGTTYFVGINIPGISTSDAYIPESLEGEYGITEQIRNVDYVITGRRSSWGMSFLDVNKILIGFMLSTAAIVGLLMYARNKRKLRQGVIPGWEDDEDI